MPKNVKFLAWNLLKVEQKMSSVLEKSKRVPVGARLPETMIERLRNAIFWHGQGLTLNGVIEKAVEKELEELENKNGGPYPHREGPIPKGRS